MKIYIKKPVAIQAIQFKITREVKCKFGVSQDHNTADICRFMGLEMLNTHFDNNGAYLIIKTLEGDMRATLGDYIIKGVSGEFYPCKPDIFKKDYYSQEEYAATLGVKGAVSQP